MPNVFISWSGDASHKVASTLYEWLPVVLQSVKPFISSEDLRKGGRWVAELSDELEKESFGILCLTPSNLVAPWVLFEAGALSKSVGDSRVAPFLVGVKPSELPSPLTQFNAVHANKDDFKKLVRSINESVLAEAVAADRIDKAVEACWAQINTDLEAAAEKTPPSRAAKPLADTEAMERFDAILQELLTLNRGQSSLLSAPEKLFPREYLEHVIGDRRRDIPGPSHAVWRDLEDGMEELRAVMRHDGSVIPISTVERLTGPIDYLLRRAGRLSSFRARPVRRSEDLAPPIPEGKDEQG